jgi:hypothetical protein
VGWQDDVRKRANPVYGVPACMFIWAADGPPAEGGFDPYVLVLVHSVTGDNNRPHPGTHEHTLAARRVATKWEDPHAVNNLFIIHKLQRIRPLIQCLSHIGCKAVFIF